MQLAPDDLVPGMFVTVLETETPPRHEGSGALPPKPGKDYTAAGAVLRVISLSLPFVLVQNMTPGMLRGPRMFPVDLRRSRLAPLSDDYVRAALADPPAVSEPITPAEHTEAVRGLESSRDGEDRGGFGGGIYFLGGGS